jgi:hypothetical protein
VIEHVGRGAYRLKLPEPYCDTHPVLDVADSCPWLTSDMHVLEQHFPVLPPHAAVNPVIQVLDRKSHLLVFLVTSRWKTFLQRTLSYDEMARKSELQRFSCRSRNSGEKNPV